MTRECRDSADLLQPDATFSRKLSRARDQGQWDALRDRREDAPTTHFRDSRQIYGRDYDMM